MKYTFLILVLGVLFACRTQIPGGAQYSANAKIPIRVGAGDDTRGHRDFRVHAKGDAIVVIFYAHDEPDGIGVDTVVIRDIERFISAMRRLNIELEGGD